MRLVDSSGNPISSGKVENKDPGEYAPEFIGSVFALVNKLTQKPEASFLYLADSETLTKLAGSQDMQNAFMSIVASYAAFTFAVKIKKMTQEEFQQTNAENIKNEMLSKLDITPLGSLPFDALFELNPELLSEVLPTERQGE